MNALRHSATRGSHVDVAAGKETTEGTAFQGVAQRAGNSGVVRSSALLH